jgi:hypothetical protein
MFCNFSSGAFVSANRSCPGSSPGQAFAGTFTDDPDTRRIAMQPALDIRRHGDGSIDFDFYRRRAMRQRRLARRLIVKHYLAVGGRIVSASMFIVANPMIIPSWRRGRRRLLMRAGASTAVQIAVAALQAWTQGDHGHHLMMSLDALK